MGVFKYSLLLMLTLSVASLAEANDGYEQWRTDVLNEVDKTTIEDSDEPTAFDYAHGQLSKDYGRILSKRRIKESEVYMTAYTQDPTLYYIRGWLGKRGFHYYAYDLKKSRKYYSPDSSESQALVKEYQSYYLQALNLDDLPDAPEHLTRSMLLTISSDILGTLEIKSRALKKASALTSEGKVQWNIFEARLSLYAQSEDYEAYLKMVTDMLEHYPQYRTEELMKKKRWAEEEINYRANE